MRPTGPSSTNSEIGFSAAIDYRRINAMADRGVMTGEWLAYCQAFSAPEIGNVFNNCGIPYRLVSGWLCEERT